MMSNIIQISEFMPLEKTKGVEGVSALIDARTTDKEHKQNNVLKVNLADPIDNKASIPELDQLTKALNEAAEQSHQQLQFKVDKETGSHIIQVIDKETQEVIRQVPGEDALKIKKALSANNESGQSLLGVLLDTRV
jgi:uncharacterized FlaG/YvyC family protein